MPPNSLTTKKKETPAGVRPPGPGTRLLRAPLHGDRERRGRAPVRRRPRDAAPEAVVRRVLGGGLPLQDPLRLLLLRVGLLARLAIPEELPRHRGTVHVDLREGRDRLIEGLRNVSHCA